MPANRVAAIGAVLSAVVGALITLLGAVPEKWQGPSLIAAVLSVTVIVVTFMLGSQKWDALVMGGSTPLPGPTGPMGPQGPAAEVPDVSDEQEFADIPEPDAATVLETGALPDTPEGDLA
jgi:hypothetical protein